METRSATSLLTEARANLTRGMTPFERVVATCAVVVAECAVQIRDALTEKG